VCVFQNLNAIEYFQAMLKQYCQMALKKRPLGILVYSYQSLLPKKIGYFVDKTDFQKPATVLGYAHMYVYSSLIFYHEVSYLLSFIYFLGISKYYHFIISLF
jgi:hypothetical protein